MNAQPRLKLVPRRGLTRAEAAEYVGIGTDLFDRAVKSGSLPTPRVIGARTIWDIVELDKAFDELPYRDQSESSNDDQNEQDGLATDVV